MATTTPKFLCKFSGLFQSQRHRTLQVGRAKRLLHAHVQSSSYSSAASEVTRWQLWSAVCLERPAIIIPDMAKLEKDYRDLLMQLEAENSYLSEHEVRHLEDAKLAERTKLEDYEETEADVSRQTALDAEDIWESEFSQIKPADRITEADKSNDWESLHRKLDRKLVLLVKQKLGEADHWVFPQGTRIEQESMRQAAERVLASHAGTSIDSTFLGNAPCGFYKYKYPPKVQAETGSIGAKVFFYKAQYRSGQVRSSDDVSEHVWLSKEELQEYLLPQYYKSVNDFILDI